MKTNNEIKEYITHEEALEQWNEIHFNYDTFDETQMNITWDEEKGMYLNDDY